MLEPVFAKGLLDITAKLLGDPANLEVKRSTFRAYSICFVFTDLS